MGDAGGAVLLLALALVLRRDKTRADRFLARGPAGSGSRSRCSWPFWRCSSSPGGVERLDASTPHFGPYTAASSTASSGSAQWGHGAVALYSYSGDVVQSQAETQVYGTGKGRTCSSIFQALGTRPAAAVLASPGSVPAGIQRPCGTTGRHGGTGVLGMLAARELEPCPESGSTRPPAWSPLSCLLLNCVTAGLLIWCSSWSWGPVRLETAWLLAICPSARCCDSGISLFRQRRLWGSGGAHRSDRRRPAGGELARPWNCPGTTTCPRRRMT